MSTIQLRDTWNEGDPYELYVGRWSRLIARKFIDWLNMPPLLGWIDVGCGTGALTEAILDMCQPRWVMGVEPSEGFLALARKRLPEKAELRLGNASNIPVDDDSADVIVSGLMLNFVASPQEGLEQMRRKTKAGGTIAAYVWDYANGMEMIRLFWDAAVQVDPNAKMLDEGERFPLCKPTALENTFGKSGITQAKVAPITISTVFRDFNDYWQPFLGGQGPAPSYVSTLDEDSRQRLVEQIRKRLRIEANGSIVLTARAWAVCGAVIK
jgi:SAM-dependent methyltransferase